jgi:hypothetical protein
LRLDAQRVTAARLARSHTDRVLLLGIGGAASRELGLDSGDDRVQPVE